MNATMATALLCIGLVTYNPLWASEAAFEHQGPTIPLKVVSSSQPEALEYYVVKPMTASTGRENLPWGEFKLCIKIFQENGRKYVAFWAAMTKNDSSWFTRPTALRKNSSGGFDFKSGDNWGDESIGHVDFLRGGQIRFEIKDAPVPDPGNQPVLGSSSTPITGTFVLPQTSCQHVRAFEQLRP